MLAWGQIDREEIEFYQTNSACKQLCKDFECFLARCDPACLRSAVIEQSKLLCYKLNMLQRDTASTVCT